MSDKCFIDTNIFVYAFLDNASSVSDNEKHRKAREFLKRFHDPADVTISAQVCSEYYSALRKNKIKDDDIRESLLLLMESIDVAPVTHQTVRDAMMLRERYSFSYWDAQIIASALENECGILYSEDMQHNQRIGKQLKIVNPFLQ